MLKECVLTKGGTRVQSRVARDGGSCYKSSTVNRLQGGGLLKRYTRHNLRYACNTIKVHPAN